MTQKYSEGIKARDAYFKGADKAADAVIASIGPFGLNLATEKGKKTTNDGFLISKSIAVALKDEFERQGALMQHEICERTNNEVADATSATIALSKGIRKELLKYLPTETKFVSSKSVEQLKKDLEKERLFVTEELKKDIKTIETKEDLIKSALVSVENEELANIIGEAQWELGQEGRLIVEEVNETSCSVEKIDGILLDNGFANSLNINNVKDQSLTLEGGYILLTNYQVREDQFEENGAIRNLIINMTQNNMNNLVIMSQAFTPNALEKIAQITNNTPFKIYGVNAPYVNQKQLILDIESVVGGKAILQEDASLDEININSLGKFSKMKMRIMGGVIAGTEENKEKKEKRIALLKEELEGEQSFFAKNQLEKRIAALNGKLAFLKIGAYLEQDRERLKDKADDAVVSIRNAWKGGTVKGGGLAFKEISDKLPENSILKKPLQIIHNQILSSAPEGFKIEEWVRDPFLTLDTALRNACEGSISMARIYGAVCTRDVVPQGQRYADEL